MTKSEVASFIARFGPVKQGFHPNGTKIHAVRANDTRAWCGRLGVKPGPLRWNPEVTPHTVDGGFYCGQCLVVWRRARADIQRMENLLTEVEKVMIERRRRASA